MSQAAGNLATVVVGGGFALGMAFGAVATRANFCTMGALSDAVAMGHFGRLRTWLLAVAVAMLGTALLAYLGLADVAKAVARRPVLPVLSLVLGGTLFGVGMTLAGGCANKNLLRLGAGSLRSLVVLVFMAMASYMSLKGLFAQWRVAYLDTVRLDLGALGWADQGLGTAVSRLSGWGAAQAGLLCAAVLALGLLIYVFKEARFRANAVQVSSGVLLGLLVVLGWYVTGHLGYGENPDTLETIFHATNSRTLESLSFVAPLAYTLELLLLWTDASLRATFGVATVLGVVLGAALTARAMGQFRWEGFASLQDLRTQLAGAMLMGFGGVTAMGCTVGQGLTGISTLALGSFIAVAAIVAGCVVTLKILLAREEG